MQQILLALAVGLVSGTLYGFLFLQHAQALISARAASMTIMFSLLRLGAFAGIVALILRWCPDHFILGLLAFACSWWVSIWFYTRRRPCKNRF